MGRQKGSALGLAEMNSDGKPCSGVRGDHEVSTEFFEENQGCFFGCEKFRENAVLGAVLPLFYFVCKKKKSQRGFEIFCSYRHFFILQIPFCVLRVRHQRYGCAPAYRPA